MCVRGWQGQSNCIFTFKHRILFVSEIKEIPAHYHSTFYQNTHGMWNWLQCKVYKVVFAYTSKIFCFISPVACQSCHSSPKWGCWKPSLFTEELDYPFKRFQFENNLHSNSFFSLLFGYRITKNLSHFKLFVFLCLFALIPCTSEERQ